MGVMDVGSDTIKAILFEILAENDKPRLTQKFVWELPPSYSGVRLMRKIREGVVAMLQKSTRSPDQFLIGVGPATAESILHTWRLPPPAGGATLTSRDIRSAWQTAVAEAGEARRATIIAPVGLLVNKYPIQLRSVSTETEIAPRESIKEIVIRALKLYLPIESGVVLADIQKIAGRTQIEILPLAWIQYRAVTDSLGVGDALLVDVGGAETTIVAVRDGQFAHVEYMPLGVRHFIDAVRRTTGHPFADSRQIVRQYGQGLGDERMRDSIAQALALAAGLWKTRFVRALNSFYTETALPPLVYLSGGGAYLPELRAAVQAADWLGKYSYAEKPMVRILEGNAFFGGDTLGGHLQGPEDAALAALVVHSLHPYPFFNSQFIMNTEKIPQGVEAASTPQRKADGIRRRVETSSPPAPEKISPAKPSPTSEIKELLPSPPPQERENDISVRAPFLTRRPPPAEDMIEVIRPASGRGKYWGAAIGGLIIAALTVIVSTLGARLTVVVHPRSQEIRVENVQMRMDTSASEVLLKEAVIPTERLTIKQNAAESFAATGKERLEDKARGKVRIYNRFSSSPQPLVVRTRFLTDGGVLYRLPKPIVVPGVKIEDGKIIPQFIEVELVADIAGEQSNLSGEIRLTIPGFKGSPRYDGFYAVAPEGFAGGFVGEAIVASEQDIERAEEQTTQRLFTELRQEMARKAPPGFVVSEALSEIEVTKVTSPQAGARGERFSIEAEAQGRVLVFREADVVALVRASEEQESREQEFIPGSTKLEYRVRSIDFEKGKAEAVVNGSFGVRTRIAASELISLIQGKKEGSITEALKSRREIASFELGFFPPWRSKAPSDPAKIKFRVEGQ